MRRAAFAALIAQMLNGCSSSPLMPLPDDRAIQNAFRERDREIRRRHRNQVPDTFAVHHVRGSRCEWLFIEPEKLQLAWCGFEHTYAGHVQGMPELWRWNRRSALLRWNGKAGWKLVGHRLEESDPAQEPAAQAR